MTEGGISYSENRPYSGDNYSENKAYSSDNYSENKRGIDYSENKKNWYDRRRNKPGIVITGLSIVIPGLNIFLPRK